MIGKTVSHYRILERLGGGGMGIVYKAVDTRLDRMVALKFLSPQLSCDEISKKRFVHEAKAASALDHPNICTIYDIDEIEDGLFIAMAYYDGETLKKKLSGSPLDLRAVIDIASQTALGLSKAHSQGILHRDIKPANLMITRDGTIKIVDFGLAKLTGQTELSRPGATYGTAAYMSPEQAQGLPLDHRTDVWSWGVVLYEMLTGKLPFQGDNHLTLFRSIVQLEPSRITEHRGDLSGDFDRFMSKVLHKNLDHRHSTILEAVEELQKLHTISGVSVQLTKAVTLIPETKIATPLKPEKKQVAIVRLLFPAYSDLLEQLSNEELQMLLRKISDELGKVAKEFHGFVNDFSGDQFTLIFGVPSAEEDDFIRAVRAARAAQSRIQELTSIYEPDLGTSVRLVCGIAAGRVVVRPSTSSDRTYELNGNAVQNAAFLATHAEPGETWILEENRRWLERFFVLEPREEIAVKGKARSIRPCSVASEVSDSNVHFWQRDDLSAYAGRSRELETLQQLLEKAENGQGQFVAVIGETGAGKSRLFYEFRRRLDPRLIRILHGGSRFYGSSFPYGPFVEAVRDALNIRDGHDDEEMAARQILELDPTLSEFIPVYFHVLGIPTSRYALPKHLQGKELQLAISEAFCAFVLSNGRGPVVFILEDWHAADEASKNLLSQLQEMATGYPVLILVNSRPECSFPAAAHHTTLYLGPLDPSSSRVIIESALGAQSVATNIVEVILERTGGNPFFIEEICRTLLEEQAVQIESGVAFAARALEHLRLPETIHSVIGTRLDRMDPDARYVLEVAAVIGREFHRSLLQRLIRNEDRLLPALELFKNHGLIQQLRVLPDATYTFKHPLVQEIAYDALLAHERKNLHGLVGEAIEEIYAGRLEERFDLLTHHFSMAERWEQAVQYGRGSARKAKAIGDFQAALSKLEKVEEWITKLPSNRQTENLCVENLLEQESICETLGIRDRQEQLLQRLLSFLNRQNDKPFLTEVHRRKGELYTLIGKFDEAEEAFNEALRLSVELEDLSSQRNAHRGKGFLNWRRGRSEEAITENELALAIDRQRNDEEDLATDLMNLTVVLRGMGRTDRALQCAEEGLQKYESVENPVKRATAFHLVANIYREIGDIERALYYFQKAMDISSASRLVITQSFHLTAIASLYSQQGKIEESMKLLKQSVELCRKSGYADGLAHSLRLLGELLPQCGQIENSLGHLEEAASIFVSVKDSASSAMVYKTMASLQEKENQTEGAIQSWRKMAALCRESGDREALASAYEAIGRLSRQHSDPESAIQAFTEALSFAEKEETKGSLRNNLGILEWKRGNYEGALAHFNAALEMFQASGDLVHAGLMLNSIGVTLKNLGKKEQAKAALKQAVEWNRNTSQRLLEGHSWSALGDISFESGEYKDALEYFNASFQIRKDIADRKGEAWMLYQLARVYAAQKNESSASQCLAEALQIGRECEENDLLRACKEFETALNTK